MVENTSARDPLAHLVGMLAQGQSGYIENMEAAGQAQLVASDRLPTKTDDTDSAFTALGFTFGPPDPDDPLFRPATLPAGWARKPSDHDMWSHIVDEHGRPRVAVFYKAAFYDRRAHMRLESVDSYIWTLFKDGGEPIFDEVWCTRQAFADALAKMRDSSANIVRIYEEETDPSVAKDLANARRELARLDTLIAKYPAVTR